MSTPYLPEKVAACLNTAAWYVRLRQAQKADKLFAKVLDMVEHEGSLADAELKSVLEKYAGTFRELKRRREAETLSQLALRIGNASPGRFNPDGSEIPWWKQPGFVQGLPALPAEFKASRAEPSSMRPFLLGCLGAFLGGGLLLATILRPVARLAGEGFVGFAWLAAIPLAGLYAASWYGRFLRRQRDESWCRMTEEGIEYHEPARHFKFGWTEIDRVWTDWVSGRADEETFDAVVVVAGTRQFRMSARFFTEQEVKWVDGLCKLKAGIE